jgi:uncharacterized protein (TIGR03435 family)
MTSYRLPAVLLKVTLTALLLLTAISLPIVAAPQTPGQNPPDASARYEVALIKPCKDEPVGAGQRRAEFRVSPGRVNIDCLTVARIAYLAYAGVGNLAHPLLNDHGQDRIRGGAGWLQTDKFSIEATAAGPAARDALMGPMLRALLEERFHLQLHREKEEVAMYALRAARSGLKIKPIGSDGCTAFDTTENMSNAERVALNSGPKPICGSYQSTGDGANRVWNLGAETLQKFANQTLSSVLDRYVLDETGVSGAFNIHLEFGLDESIAVGVFGGRGVNPPPTDIERGPSIFTALEQQLGLKLENTRGTREFLVIDGAQKPQ